MGGEGVGVRAMANDNRFRALYEELRRLKREEMPRKMDNPIDQARHDVEVAAEIGRVERLIEEEMGKDGRVYGGHEAGKETV